MRAIALLLILLLMPWTDARSQEKPHTLFSERPDVLITVKEHAMTSEDVTATVVIAGYPLDTFRRQLDNLGRELKSPVRVLYVTEVPTGQAKGNFIKASFSVNGLIDREKGVYRLQPLARAFAGVEEPFTVRNIQVTLENELGSAGDLAEMEVKDAWRVEANRNVEPLPMIEYRIQLLTQDPSKIVIPEKYAPPVQTVKEKPAQTSNTLFYVLVGATALAAGVLVYLALLRLGTRSRS